MTFPRLPLVKAQRSFLSGIRLCRERHGTKSESNSGTYKKREFGTLGALDLRSGKYRLMFET